MGNEKVKMVDNYGRTLYTNKKEQDGEETDKNGGRW